MKCMICSQNMDYYFSKYFGVNSLGDVKYYRCPECGFSSSKTHVEMPETDWEHLNISWHDANNRRTHNPWNRSQRHFNQALMIHLLNRHGIIRNGEWLDYASGQGDLSCQLYSHFGHVLRNFDKYVQPTQFPVAESDLVRRSYSLVTNTAMFEHVRHRDTLDEIESHVEDNGCLGIHTLVRGEIPADPEWMYLLPVHCAFFTNKCMNLLMQQWGYTCSIYNEYAKMWIWFKQDSSQVDLEVANLNQMMGWECFHFKKAFVDYWP